jgi:hypothetical protein
MKCEITLKKTQSYWNKKPWFAIFVKPSGFGRSGGNGEDETPDPIPNSAVKSLSVDGTVPQGAGE